jgi:hypothetical protein
VVAQPLRRAEELVALWLCVAPLRLGGLRGKKSTPSVWLGGTGEFIGSRQAGAGATGTSRSTRDFIKNRRTGSGKFLS